MKCGMVKKICNISDLKKRALLINNICEKYDEENDVELLDINDLYNILYDTRLISYEIERVLNEKIDYSNSYSNTNFNEAKQYILNNSSRKILQNFVETASVKITRSGDYLKIHTPFLFKRVNKNVADKNKFYQNFIVADMIKRELSRLKTKEGLSKIFDINDLPFVVFTVRRAENFNNSKHCDNDNYEVKEIINYVLSDEFGVSDNALNMTFISMFSTCKNSEEEGMDIYFIPERVCNIHLYDPKLWLEGPKDGVKKG